MKYNVAFTYRGLGSIEIEADNEEQAKEKFYNGEYDMGAVTDNSEDYKVDEVTLYF